MTQMVTLWEKFNTHSIPPKHLTLFKFIFRSSEKDIKDSISPFGGFPCVSDGKESACSAGDLGLIPGLGRSPEKGMATHSSILAWEIPWTEDSGGLQSMGSQKNQKPLSNNK